MRTTLSTSHFPLCRPALIIAGTMILCLLALASCNQASEADEFTIPVYSPKYASGFEILGAEGRQSTIIVTKNPWQAADSSFVTRIFIARNGESAPEGFDGQIVSGNASRIVCMSSSYVAMLDAFGEVQRVVGVSGINFVSCNYVQAHRNSIGDIGFDGNLDYELLISLSPDIVLLYGVNGASGMEPKLKELGIPFAYIGEYLEQSPLGKAEWMVAVGDIAGERQKAIARYNDIPRHYNELKASVSKGKRPKVMINTPYGDSWVMASTTSYVAQLISDAGGEYVYSQNSSSQSMPIDMEQAYLLAAQSDVWINASNFATLADLKKAYPKFADTKPVASGNVWDNSLRATPLGGNDYCESGVVYPDKVLEDLILIFHPEAAQNGQFNYYRKLE